MTIALRSLPSSLTFLGLIAAVGCASPHAPRTASNAAPRDSACTKSLDQSELGDEVLARLRGTTSMESVVQTAAMPAYLRGAPARAARYREAARTSAEFPELSETIDRAITANWKEVPYKVLDEYASAWSDALEECRKHPNKRSVCDRMIASAEGVAQAKRDGLAPVIIKHLDHARAIATLLDAVSGPEEKSDESPSSHDETSEPPSQLANSVLTQCRDIGLPAPPLVVAENAPPRSLVARVNVSMGIPRHKVQYTGSAFVLVTHVGSQKRVFAVTNAHVVGFAEHVSLVFGDGRAFSNASVALVDSDHDLALIELPDGSFAAGAGVANGLVKELSDVVSVGFPEGSYQIATGAVTNNTLTRPAMFGPVEFVQHSAPIHFGSSGGPLLDKSQRVVGVNTILRSDRENTAFAIPASRVSALINDAIATPRIINADEHRQTCLAAVLGAKVKDDHVADNILAPLLSEALYESWSDAGAGEWSDPLRGGSIQLANILLGVRYAETCSISKRMSDRSYEFELQTIKGKKLFLRTGVLRGAAAITRIEGEDASEKPK